MAFQQPIDQYLTRSLSNPSLSGKRPADDNIEAWRTAKRSAMRRTITGRPHLSTSNRFESLPVDVDSDSKSAPFREASTHKKKVGHIPPIVIQTEQDWTHETIMSLISKFHKGFHLQYRGMNKIAVLCYTPEAHQLIKEGLRKENKLFLTYTRKDEKQPKVVIRGLPAYVENQLADELASLGFEGVSVTKLKNKTSGHMSCPPFLVNLPVGANILKFRQIKYLSNCVVEIQKFKPNNTMGTQCFRCQAFGHSSRNCNMPPRCVKCTESHPTRDCLKKDRKEPARCCNCLDNHPANYPHCPLRQQYIERLRLKRVDHHRISRHPITPQVPNKVHTDGRSWAEVASGDILTTSKPTSELPKSSTMQQDQASKEMLDILMTIKSLKQQFLDCTSMMDKVILILTHLGQYV